MQLREINPFVRKVCTTVLSVNARYEVYNELRTPDCRLFYMMSGTGSVTVAGHAYKLKPRCAVLMQSGVRYTWQPSVDDALRFIAVNFDYTQNFTHIRKSFHPVHAEDFPDDAILERVRFTDAQILNAPIVFYEAGMIENLLRMLSTEFYLGSDFGEELLSSLMKSIILTIVRAAGENSPANSSKGSVLTREIIKYIQNNYREDITNEKIAEMFHFDSSYINRVFKKHTGSSLHAFLRSYRLSMAMDLLRTRSAPVSEIAASVGFTDPAHFTKSFRLYTGVTPSEYAKTQP